MTGNLWDDLHDSDSLSCEVLVDSTVKELSAAFDYEFTGKSSFSPPILPDIPSPFAIGLIVGPSGTGKSTALKRFGYESPVSWEPHLAICSHFKDALDAQERLSAVGFNSIPSWMRPYHVLSTGEKFRADIARRLGNGAVIDEFTSVVDRNVAKSCAYSIRRYADKSGLKNMVFASCHYDIIEWLRPDWVFDTSTNRMVGRGCERRPQVTLEVLPCTHRAWKIFRHHHYLDGNINKAARCWIAAWNETPVGFAAALPFPNGNLKNAWRGHRTVVLPDYQGLGFGVRISDAVAMMFLSEGCRYFSKTAHPRMGEYRNKSPLWEPTTKNERTREDYSTGRCTLEKDYKMKHAHRLCYSHEFKGSFRSEGSL